MATATKAAPKPATAAAPKKAAPAKAPGEKTAAAVNTITLKQLAVEIAETHELQRKSAEAILNDLVDAMVSHLVKGDRLRLNKLGILEVKKRAARMGRNPATGAQIEIKASKKVGFRPAKELKEAV